MDKYVRKILSVKPTVTYEELPECFMDVLQTAEDPSFMKHHGVDWVALKYSVRFSIRNKKLSSGSTLTMQLVKNVCYKHDCEYDHLIQKFSRKLIEIPVSIKLEKVLSKKEIVERYLSVVNFGNGCIGLKSAARFYYQKEVADLTPYQCVELVAILKDSVYREPIRYPESNRKRSRTIIKNLVRCNFAQARVLLNNVVVVDNENKYALILPQDNNNKA
ncbi:MAG: transglycosylase domain-containing protein [Enterococcus sp.]|nr:transglycosylase domain-containing protein [Enterococcus sp.]